MNELAQLSHRQQLYNNEWKSKQEDKLVRHQEIISILAIWTCYLSCKNWIFQSHMKIPSIKFLVWWYYRREEQSRLFIKALLLGSNFYMTIKSILKKHGFGITPNAIQWETMLVIYIKLRDWVNFTIPVSTTFASFNSMFCVYLVIVSVLYLLMKQVRHCLKLV